MVDYQKQAFVALEIYLSRGKATLNQLEQGKIKNIDKMLRSRSAAFYNFRTADHLLVKQGVDLSQHPDFNNLWGEIQENDAKLQLALRSAVDDMNDELIRSRRAKFNIGKYKSGVQLRSMFEQVV